MNCRRVNSLLSAYIDSELTGEEMLAVRSHLSHCEHCQSEHQALLQTKRLLASLMTRAPRAELESLLLHEIERETGHPLKKWLPFTPFSTFLYQVSDAWENALATLDETRVRPNTVAATVLLTVAGLWVASTSLDYGNGDAGVPSAYGPIMAANPMPLTALPAPGTLLSRVSSPAYATAGFTVEDTAISRVAYASDGPPQLGVAAEYTPGQAVQAVQEQPIHAGFAFSVPVTGVSVQFRSERRGENRPRSARRSFASGFVSGLVVAAP